jgi:hypothetical protein
VGDRGNEICVTGGDGRIGESVNVTSVIVGQVDVAGFVLTERADREAAGQQLCALPRAPGAAERPHPPAAVVREEIEPLHSGVESPPVDETPGDRAPLVVSVLEHRLHQPGLSARVGVEAVARLHDPPPVVLASGASGRLKVDLLVLILTDVGDVEIAGATVEGKAPWVSETERPDLAPVPGSPHERVRGGHRVRFGPGLDVDSKDLAQERGRVLCVVLRVAGGAAVPHPDVLVTVGAERELAAVVVGTAERSSRIRSPGRRRPGRRRVGSGR